MKLILFYRNQAGNHTSINTKTAQCEHKGWSSPLKNKVLKIQPFKINENFIFRKSRVSYIIHQNIICLNYI